MYIVYAVAYKLILYAIVHILVNFHFAKLQPGGYIVINLVGSFNEEEDLGATLNLKIFDIVFEGRNDE